MADSMLSYSITRVPACFWALHSRATPTLTLARGFTFPVEVHPVELCRRASIVHYLRASQQEVPVFDLPLARRSPEVAAISLAGPGIMTLSELVNYQSGRTELRLAHSRIVVATGGAQKFHSVVRSGGGDDGAGR